MNYGYGELVQISPYCPEQGPSYWIGWLSQEAPRYWVFAEDLIPSELETKILSKDRGESLRRKYEARKFDWAGQGLKENRPSFEAEPTVYEGQGWKTLISKILAEWDGERVAELVKVEVSLNRGYEKSSLKMNKKFVCYPSFHPKQIRVQGFMKHCTPSPDWIRESGRSVQILMDNRPEFGLSNYQPRFDQELIEEMYRISGEIALCLASHG